MTIALIERIALKLRATISARQLKRLLGGTDEHSAEHSAEQRPRKKTQDDQHHGNQQLESVRASRDGKRLPLKLALVLVPAPQIREKDLDNFVDREALASAAEVKLLSALAVLEHMKVAIRDAPEHLEEYTIAALQHGVGVGSAW